MASSSRATRSSKRTRQTHGDAVDSDLETLASHLESVPRGNRIHLGRLCTDLSFFENRAQYALFTSKMSEKKVLVERLFSEPFLTRINWPYLQRLKDWGWWHFINDVEGVACPMICKVFYFRGDVTIIDRHGNPEPLSRSGNNFSTSVLGHNLRVNRHSLGQLFPNTQCNDGFLDPTMNEIEALRVIMNDNTITHWFNEVTMLDLNTRLLLFLFSYVLKPKIGSHSGLTQRDAKYMAMIIRGERPNLCELLARHMADTVTKLKHGTQVGLPYGKLVTKFCRDNCSNFGNEAPGGTVIEILDEDAIKEMGWREVIVDNAPAWRWYPIKNKTRRNANLEEEAQVEEEEQVGENVFNMQAFANEMRDMHAQSSTRMDRIEERQGRVEEEQLMEARRSTYVYESMLALHNHFHIDAPNLPYPFPYPPPPPPSDS